MAACLEKEMSNDELQDAIDSAIKYLAERLPNDNYTAVYEQLVLMMKEQVRRAGANAKND